MNTVLSRNLRFSVMILLLLVVFIANIFSIGGKEKIPMQLYQNLDIADGEYLRYGFYMGGEKTSDLYQVTKKEINQEGNILLHVYQHMLPIASGKKPPADYHDWGIYCLIDSQSVWVLESTGNLEEGSMDNYGDMAGGKLLSFDYKLYAEQGYAEYVSKLKNGEKILTKSYRIKVDTDFPLIFTWGSQFIYRLIDPRSPGIIYWIMPDFLKDPIPYSYQQIGKETISTKVGTFQTNKVKLFMGDVFLGKLVESAIQSTVIYVEDSNRRLTIKSISPFEESILEEISIIND